MSEIEATSNDWRELREFKGVDLSESFVLSWHLSGEVLRLDIDLCLLPSHVFYESPRPAETACYRAAVLQFPACTLLRRQDSTDAAQTAAELAATLGHGKITCFRRVSDGRYEIYGRFGEVELAAGRPILKIRESIS
jgi:hypothetical protein